jgi:dTDP-D-glucose 4,6-dehydratase
VIISGSFVERCYGVIAGEICVRPVLRLWTDVLGTQTVANAVLKSGKKIRRFIHISNSEVYGAASTESITEEHPLNPMSPCASV